MAAEFHWATKYFLRSKDMYYPIIKFLVSKLNMVHVVRMNLSDFPIRIPVTPLMNSEIEMRFKFFKNADYKIVRRIQI